MKVCVMYESKTGNTKMLADIIEEVFKDQLVSEPEDAELVFMGSWTDKGSFAGTMAEKAQTLRNKKVFIFGTCGFGGEEYYQQLFMRASALLDGSNRVIGHFYCAGKMPLAVRDRYVSMLREHPDDRYLQVSVENFDRSLSHPDDRDLSDLRSIAEKIKAQEETV